MAATPISPVSVAGTPAPDRAVESSPLLREQVGKHVEPGWYSQRTHGRVEPNRGTITRRYPKIGRNAKVRIHATRDQGNLQNPIPTKFKRFAFSRLPIQYEVTGK